MDANEVVDQILNKMNPSSIVKVKQAEENWDDNSPNVMYSMTIPPQETMEYQSPQYHGGLHVMNNHDFSIRVVVERSK